MDEDEESDRHIEARDLKILVLKITPFAMYIQELLSVMKEH